MLKPLPSPQSQPQENLPPPRTCEACGTVVPGNDAINCIFVVGIAGHPDIPPFQCAHEEHFSCSIPCWQKVAHACIDEHIAVMLRVKHQELGPQSVHYEG